MYPTSFLNQPIKSSDSNVTHMKCNYKSINDNELLTPFLLPIKKFKNFLVYRPNQVLWRVNCIV